MTTDILADLRWRELLHQSTDEAELAKLLAAPQSAYVGFDPTAESLHVGHMMGLMTLRRFQNAGHRAIALVGGATGMVGDPSGKSQERNLLSVDDLNANVAAIKEQMGRFLDFEGDSGAQLVNNYDWMSRFSYLDFLRDIGKHFPVNVMMTKDSVKRRLEGSDAGISYTEFSYMLLQAYDFAHLFEHHDCRLQLGGSDQWGNITAGIDLVRRMHGQHLHGATWPLLTKSDGEKMGKTASGAVWLSARKTSPYQFYQYWVNVADADAGKCLRSLTELPHEEIEALDQSRVEAPQQRQSQKRLAQWITQLVHGEPGLRAAEQATQVFFGQPIENLSDAELTEIFSDVPSQTLAKNRLGGEGLSLLDAFVEAGLVKSKGEARRRVKEGGAYVNNHKRTDFEQRLTAADLASETVMVLRSGKKKYALLRFEG